MNNRSSEWLEEAKIISKILSNSPNIDKKLRISPEEFKRRQQKIIEAIKKEKIDAAFVYSNEQYNGDVPYLGGNTNITVEPVAGVIGKNGFYILAGLEGGYVAEQLSPRSGARICKVEMLKLADEDYQIDSERIEDVIEEAAGGKPDIIGLLTPRAVFPVNIYEFLINYLGDSSKIVDSQEIYYKIKYEKSREEIDLIRDASLICDEMVKCMLAVLKPGMLETQISQWGYAVGQELGSEEMGFDIMVNANEANRTMIGKSLNRVINEGDIVSIGVAPKRDGLTACERVSVVCTNNSSNITEDQKYWFDFIEKAYTVGLEAYKMVARDNLPAKLQEQALVDYFNSKKEEVEKIIGKKIDLIKQKPYTGTHNGGYTECQEFYGAITLNSNEPLGHNIVTMLDVAIKGTGNKFNEIIIPNLDYLVIERTLEKSGPDVEVLTKLPINVQHLIGRES
ncbi:MAG: M24 family metallopeptidase [Actinomycetota bacterium]|nr:M24 family metallopeptidase [Actinomycetota bacterium]